MDSPSGKILKEKFAKLLKRDANSQNSVSVSDFQDYVNSGLIPASRNSRTSSISLNRGSILTDFEEDEILKSLENDYYSADFDSSLHELSKFPENFDQASVDIQRQKLLRQLKVVTKRAFAQILEKRPECTLEFENIRLLEEDLRV